MKVRFKALTALFLVVAFVVSTFMPAFIVAANANDDGMLDKILLMLENEDEEISDQYPSGIFDFVTVINEVDENSKEPLKLYVARHGGTEGEAVINLKFADYSAEYGKDYYAKIGNSLFNKKIDKNEESRPLLYMFSDEGDKEEEDLTRGDLVDAFGEERVSEMQEALEEYNEKQIQRENLDASELEEDEFSSDFDAAEELDAVSEIDESKEQIEQPKKALASEKEDDGAKKLTSSESALYNLNDQVSQYSDSDIYFSDVFGSMEENEDAAELTWKLMENVFPGTEAELVFEDGEQVKEICIYPIANNISDGNRVFTVVLNGGSENVTISENNSATCTIIDDEDEEISYVEVDIENTPSIVDVSEDSFEIKLKRTGGLYQTTTHTLLAYTDKNEVLIHGTVLYMPGMESQTVKVDTAALKESDASTIYIKLDNAMGCTVPSGVSASILIQSKNETASLDEIISLASSDGKYYTSANSPIAGLSGYGAYDGFRADINSQNMRKYASGGNCNDMKNKVNDDHYLLSVPNEASGCKNSYTMMQIGEYYNLACVQSFSFEWSRDDHSSSKANRFYFSYRNDDMKNWDKSGTKILALRGDLSRHTSTIDVWSGSVSNAGETLEYKNDLLSSVDKNVSQRIFLTSKKTSGGINGMTANIYGFNIKYREYNVEAMAPDNLQGHSEIPGLLEIKSRDNMTSSQVQNRYAIEKLNFSQKSVQPYAKLVGMYLADPRNSARVIEISSSYFDVSSMTLDLSAKFFEEYRDYIDINSRKIRLKPIYEQKNMQVIINTDEYGGIEVNGQKISHGKKDVIISCKAGDTINIKPYDIGEEYAFAEYTGSMNEVNSPQKIRDIPFERSSEEQNLYLEYYDYHITPKYSYTGTQVQITTPEGMPDGSVMPGNMHITQKEHGIKAGHILTYKTTPAYGYRASWKVKTEGHPWYNKVFYGDSFDYEILSGDNNIELTFEYMGGENYVKFTGTVQAYQGTVREPPIRDPLGNFIGIPSVVEGATVSMGDFISKTGSDGVFSLYSREELIEGDNKNTTFYARMWPNETHTVKVTYNNITQLHTIRTSDFLASGGTHETPKETYFVNPITVDFYGMGPVPKSILTLSGDSPSVKPAGGEDVAIVNMANNTVGFKLTLENVSEETKVERVDFRIYSSDMALKETYSVDTDEGNPLEYVLDHYSAQDDDGEWMEMYFNGLLNFSDGDRVFVDIIGAKYDLSGKPAYFSYGMYDTGVSFREVPGQSIDAYIPDITVDQSGGIPTLDIIGGMIPAISAGPLSIRAVITGNLMEFSVGFNVPAFNKQLYQQGITGQQNGGIDQNENVAPQEQLDEARQKIEDLEQRYNMGEIVQEDFEQEMNILQGQMNLIEEDINNHANVIPEVLEDEQIVIEEPDAAVMADPQSKAQKAANMFGKQINDVNKIIDQMKKGQDEDKVRGARDAIVNARGGINMNVMMTFGITVRMVPNAERHTWVFDSAMVYGQVGFGIVAVFYTTVPSIPVPLYLGFGFSTSAGLYNGMQARYATTLEEMSDGNWTNPPPLYYKGYVPISVGIELFVGVGIRNLLNLELGGGFLQEFNLAWGTGQQGVGITTFYAYSQINLVIFSAKWRFAQKSWNYSLYETTPLYEAASLMEEHTNSMDVELKDLTIDTQEYRNQMQGVVINDVSLASDLEHHETYTLVEDGVNMKTAIAPLDGERYIMLFEGADTENRNRYNQNAVFFTLFDGLAWSKPQILQDDGTLDTNVNVEVLGDQIIISWSSSDKMLDDDAFVVNEEGELNPKNPEEIKEVLNSFDLYSIILEKSAVNETSLTDPNNVKRVTDDKRTTEKKGYFNSKADSVMLDDGRIFMFYTTTDYNSYPDIEINTLSDLLAVPGVTLFRIYENGEWSESYDYDDVSRYVGTNHDWYGQRMLDINLTAENGNIYYPVSGEFDAKRILFEGKERILASYIVDADGNFNTTNDRAVCMVVINPEDGKVSTSLPVQLSGALSNVSKPYFVETKSQEFGDVTFLTWAEGNNLLYYDVNQLFMSIKSDNEDDVGEEIPSILTETTVNIGGKEVVCYVVTDGAHAGYAIRSTNDNEYQLGNGYSISSGEDGNVYVVWSQSEGAEQKLNISTLQLDFENKNSSGYQTIWSKPKDLSLKVDGDESREYISQPAVCVNKDSNMMIAHNSYDMHLITERNDDGKEIAVAKEKKDNDLCVSYMYAVPSLELSDLTLSNEYPAAGTEFAASVQILNDGVVQTDEIAWFARIEDSNGLVVQTADEFTIPPLVVGRCAEVAAKFSMTQEMIDSAIHDGIQYKVIFEAKESVGEPQTEEADIKIGSKFAISDIFANGYRSRETSFDEFGKLVFGEENGGNRYFVGCLVENVGNVDADKLKVGLAMENRMSHDVGGWPGIDADESEMIPYLENAFMNASVVNSDRYKPYVAVGGAMINQETSVAVGQKKKILFLSKIIDDEWFTENGALSMYLDVRDENDMPKNNNDLSSNLDTISTFGVLRADLLRKGTLEITKNSNEIDSVSAKKGESFDLDANIMPQYLGIIKNVVWSSSNENVATVDNSGLVVAKGSGKTVITASIDEFELLDQVEVTVSGGSGGGGLGGGSSTSTSTSTPKPSSEPISTEIPLTGVFVDVTETYWGYRDIVELYNAGIVNGQYEDGKLVYLPENNVTRAEFTKMAVMLFGLPFGDTSTSFDDVSQYEWHAPYIAAAQEAGLVTGYTETEFGPDGFVLRQEMCAILGRHLNLDNKSEASFIDFAEIDEYARLFVSAMTENNIVNGYEDGTFRPKNNAVRSESAAIINRVRKR